MSQFPKYMRQVTAMKYLDLPKSTWYDLKSRGMLPEPIIKNINGNEFIRYDKDDLDEWLLGEENESKPIKTTK